jgi:glucose/arabinose dehydrogenase
MEQGLLGLAFHPKFAQNRQFFVHYSQKGTGNTQLTRYTTMADDPSRADPASAEVILEVDQPFSNHNGGQITFGPDGFLYMGLGDGGSAGDPNNNAQNRGSLLGKILRIDVDTASAGNKYGIPSSNPFVSTSGARPEIWAYGLRNPWRFSFDRPTGRLWAGDVGQNKFEEVDLIARGGNYGWRLTEGVECFNPATNCPRTGITFPLAVYSHDLGISVTGGYVYRGARVPALNGLFLYGDFGSGRMWGLRYANGKGTALELGLSGLSPSTFGMDKSGEVYVGSYSEGRIYRFK